MARIDFSKRIFLSITGGNNVDWQEKLKEINELKIDTVAVFLERFEKQERDNLRRFLLKSAIKKVPLVHLRHDVKKEEIKFFIDNFGTEHFNIHEENFGLLDSWKGYWDKLYLEMNYDSEIAKNVKVRQIGGFCVDLAHFKAAISRGSEEAYYIFLRKNKVKFSCNHISGYSERKRSDIHVVKSLKDFDYIASLPKYVFGEIMAMEVDNNIGDQIRFKKYLADIFNKNF